LEILQLFAGVLGKKVVPHAHGHVPLLMQPLNDLVVIGVVLKAATSIGATGDAEAIEFAHEVPRAVVLIFTGEFGAEGESFVKDEGVGASDEQAGGFAIAIADNLAAGGAGELLPCSPPCGARHDSTSRGHTDAR
jgi:hypothetical protein